MKKTRMALDAPGAISLVGVRSPACAGKNGQLRRARSEIRLEKELFPGKNHDKR